MLAGNPIHEGSYKNAGIDASVSCLDSAARTEQEVPAHEHCNGRGSAEPGR